MLAHGRETVSAQCLLQLVDAVESVRRQCLAREPARMAAETCSQVRGTAIARSSAIELIRRESKHS
jgi:hypothetical protein